eukprot:GHVT01009290.1.p1 GENE.GHVT01009290.1~~GHVT01009290.1.p1  ORF type:complete len:242 (+),score=66.63 GHVT01009290.1:1361-2086(+)
MRGRLGKAAANRMDQQGQKGEKAQGKEEKKEGKEEGTERAMNQTNQPQVISPHSHPRGEDEENSCHGGEEEEDNDGPDDTGNVVNGGEESQGNSMLASHSILEKVSSSSSPPSSSSSSPSSSSSSSSASSSLDSPAVPADFSVNEILDLIFGKDPRQVVQIINYSLGALALTVGLLGYLTYRDGTTTSALLGVYLLLLVGFAALLNWFFAEIDLTKRTSESPLDANVYSAKNHRLAKPKAS